MAEVADKRKVFLVHGRDSDASDALVQLLWAFDLKVIPWDDAATEAGGGAPFTDEIVRAGMHKADAVVVLLTPDDVGYLRPRFHQNRDGLHEREPTGQARLNVVYEAGMAMALDRNRVVIVEVGTVRRMSDTDGLDVVRLDDTFKQRRQLAARLKATGLTVDTEHRDEAWRSAGTFSRPALTEKDLAVAGSRAPVGRRAGQDKAGPHKRPPRAAKAGSYEPFWQRFLDRVRAERPAWTGATAAPSRNSFRLDPVSGIGYYVVGFTREKALRAELYVDTGDAETNVARFRAIEAHQREIDKAFGSGLSWEELSHRCACRIASYHPWDVRRVDEHDEYLDWFIEVTTRLHTALGPWTK